MGGGAGRGALAADQTQYHHTMSALFMQKMARHRRLLQAVTFLRHLSDADIAQLADALEPHARRGGPEAGRLRVGGRRAAPTKLGEGQTRHWWSVFNPCCFRQGQGCHVPVLCGRLNAVNL